MARFLAGAAACFLLLTGAFLFWQSRAEEAPLLPAAPAARTAAAGFLASNLPAPPEATPKSREEKRFSRSDKDKNGRIEREELLGPRRKAFAKLDTNGNGSLSFEDWGRQDDRQVQWGRQGPVRLALGRRIRDDRAPSAEKSALFVLNMS
ncbi:MAG TPA: EF-hand domain-containing protein [Sphingomicrobium sp.]